MKRLISSVLTVASFALFADVPGSSDSDILTRYTASTIIEYGLIDGSYDFIYASVDKIKRDVSFESSVRFTGSGQKITYEIPRGVSRKDALRWYTSQLDRLGGTTLFSCDGPDCGRATIWASQIFRIRSLSAPDRQQSYTAYALGEDADQTLVALYVVERGNKRVIAHIEVVKPSAPVTFDENRGFSDSLNATGIAVIRNVTPGRDGSIDAEAKVVLSDIAEQLSNFLASDIYVVCHMHASGSADPLIEASGRCAEEVAALLSEKSSFEPKALGVGPLIPVEGRKLSRVEVVVPSLMRQVSR